MRKIIYSTIILLILANTSGPAHSNPETIEKITKDTNILKAKINRLKSQKDLAAAQATSKKIKIISAEYTYIAGKCSAASFTKSLCQDDDKCAVSITNEICSIPSKNILTVNYKCGIGGPPQTATFPAGDKGYISCQ